MAYGFLVQNFYKQRLDGSLTGALIFVRCDRKDDASGEVTGSAILSWYADKGEFAGWPPTRQQARDYIVAYLQTTPPGQSETRVEAMKAATPVIVQDEEIWAAGEKVLPIT